MLLASPTIDPSAYVAPGAIVRGHVCLGAQSSVWFGCVLRAEHAQIEVGARSNVQDGAVLHVDEGFPVRVGEDVTIGHRAVVHGATLERGCLIGIGAIVLNGAVVGAEALIGAGALVAEGKHIPPRSLVMGVPGKVVRTLSDEELDRIRLGVAHYVEMAQAYAAEDH